MLTSKVECTLHKFQTGVISKNLTNWTLLYVKRHKGRGFAAATPILSKIQYVVKALILLR